MPKRARDKESKSSAPPMSAFAARQLRAAQEAAATASSSSPTPTPTQPAFPMAIASSSEVSSKKGSKTVTTTSTTAPIPTLVKQVNTGPSTPPTPNPIERNVSARRALESARQRQFRAQHDSTAPAIVSASVESVTDEDDGSRMSLDEGEDVKLRRVQSDPNYITFAATSFHHNGTPRFTNPPTPILSTTDSTILMTIVTTLSNFTPSPENTTSQPGKSTIFRLKPRETLVLQGEYILRVISGSITIYGATISPKNGMNVVYAPSTHALPVIEAVTQEKRKRKGDGVGGEGVEWAAEIEVGCWKSGLREVGKICPAFGGVWKPAGVPAGADTFYPILKVVSPTPIPRILAIPKQWKKFLTKFTALPSSPPPSINITIPPPPPVIILTGSKSTGKSTLSRLLLNHLLLPPPSPSSTTPRNYTRVAYLDLDPGQPEFSPPGVISLTLHTSPILGPPFTHPAGPSTPSSSPSSFSSFPTWFRAHHIGYVTPREDPGHYIGCIRDLFSTYQKSILGSSQDEEVEKASSSVPLIINTCGYIKGAGMEILSDIIAISRPTDLVLLSHEIQLAQASAPTSSTLHHYHQQRATAASSGLDSASRVAGGARASTTIPPSSSSLIHTIPHLLSTISPETNFHSLTAPVTHPSTTSSAPASAFTPADLRTLQTISYFHHYHYYLHHLSNEGEISSFPKWTFTTGPLTHQPPLLFPRDSIENIHILQSDGISPEFLGDAVVGTLVGVVVRDDPEEEEAGAERRGEKDGKRERERERWTDGLKPWEYPPNPDSSHCVGLAVVRYLPPPPLPSLPPPSPTSHSPINNEYLATTLHLLLPPQTNPTSWFPTSTSKISLVRGRLDTPPHEVIFDRKDDEVEVPWVEYTPTSGSERKRRGVTMTVGLKGLAGAKGWRVRRNLMRRRYVQVR